MSVTAKANDAVETLTKKDETNAIMQDVGFSRFIIEEYLVLQKKKNFQNKYFQKLFSCFDVKWLF